MGEQCEAFEHAFSRFQGRKFTALVNSGSSANLVLLQALLNLGRLKRGDKVAFSSVTWPTNVMPIIQLGLTPIPVDIERQTLNVGSETLRNTLQLHPDIKCLSITNILGFCGDLDAIEDLCSRQGIILLEDNCESFGTVYQGRKLGNFSLASTCSSFVGHHLSTIEGGVVATDDPELNKMIRMVRAHGWDRNATATERDELRKRFGIDPFYDLYTFYEAAYNVRPTEITGFLGLIQLEVASTIVRSREQNFQRFQNAASTNPDLLPIRSEHIELVSNFAYPVISAGNEVARSMRKRFSEAGVEIRPIVAGNITSQPFFRKYSGAAWELPEADFIHQHGFYFPNNPELTEEETQRLIVLLEK